MGATRGLDRRLVGRAAEWNAARRAIEQGRAGVIFTGEPGVGKTSLARAVVEGLNEGDNYEVLWLLGTATDPEIPFCAFAPYVPHVVGDNLAGPGGPGSLTLLQTVRAGVLRRAAGRKLLLVVDDAHLLGGHSATLVLQLVLAGEASVVVAAQSGHPVASALRSLWREGLAERIDVSPLDHDATAELVTDLLSLEEPAPAVERMDRPGRLVVGGELTETVWRVSNGNPLYARELVLTGLRRGRITRNDGAWRLEGDLEVGPRLTELVTERLAVLSPDEREALELVAHGAPLALPLRALLRLVTCDSVEALHQKGMIHLYWARGEQLARTGHPVTAEVIRQGLPVTRAVELGRRLADAFEADGRGESELVRVMTWRLHAGVACPPEALVRASCRAAEHDEWRHSEWLARQACRAGAGAEGALVLADAQRAIGRLDDALATLADTPGSGDDQTARIAILRASILFLGMGRLEQALDTLDQAAVRVEGRSDRTWLEGVRAGLLGFAGRPGEAAEAAAQLLGRDGLSVRTELTVRSALAMSLAWTGRTEQAQAVLDAMTGGTEQVPVLAAWAVTARTLTYRLAGQVELLERLSRTRYDMAVRRRDRFSQGLAAGSLGAVAVERAHLEEAVTWLTEAVRALRTINSPVMGVNAQLNLVEALALLGDVEEARQALEVARPVAGRATGSAGWSVASGWLAAAQGYVTEALQHMSEGAEKARAGGQVMAEIRALHSSARLGSDQAADRLAELAQTVEGPLISVIARHAAALRPGPGRGDALDQIAALYADLDLQLYAAEAAAQASQAHASSGQTRRAAASAARGHFLIGSDGDRQPPLGLALALTPAVLTRREQEVARLAAGGLPSQAIATRLCLSVRTVETHLARAYLKLGISGRPGLAEALLQSGVVPERVEAG
jgi:DNA-binding CsgD family transcriptional regulator